MLNYRLFHLSVIVASYMLRFIPGTYRFIDQSTNGEKVGVMASVHCRRMGTLVPIALNVSQFSCISLHFFLGSVSARELNVCTHLNTVRWHCSALILLLQLNYWTRITSTNCVPILLSVSQIILMSVPSLLQASQFSCKWRSLFWLHPSCNVLQDRTFSLKVCKKKCSSYR